MTPRAINHGIIVGRGLTALAATLTLLILAACGGGGGGGSDPDPTKVTITGVVDDGGHPSPIPNASCRFVDTDGQTLATDNCDLTGNFHLTVPPGVEGYIHCSPPAVPSLSLATFASTVGAVQGEVIDGENVTPATTVAADIIQLEESAHPEIRKNELLTAIVSKTDPNLEIVVAMATRLYRAMLAQQVNAGFRSGGHRGDGGEGNGGSDSDVGGASGDAGDGADFSPLAGAQCRFVSGHDPLSAEQAYPSAMADFLEDGELDRPDLAGLAATVTDDLELDADQIRGAFAEVFSDGMGEAFVTTTDADGHYFMPVPANLPGFVLCTPQGRDQLTLATHVPGHSPGVILNDQHVTPATTAFSYVIAPQVEGDLAGIKENFLADIAGLTVHLTGDNLPEGPLAGIALGTDPLPSNPEVGLVAFTVTALYNVFYKNGLDVDFAAIIAKLVDNRVVDPDYLETLGLPADQAAILGTAIDTAATALDTTLADALSTARVNVTVMNVDDNGSLVPDALIDIPDLEAPITCDGCTTATDVNGQLTLTLSNIARDTAIPIAVTVSSVEGFEPVSAATEVVALVTVDLDVALSTATTYSLSLQAGGSGGGRVTSAPAGIDCTLEGDGVSGDCSEPFVEGTEITLTAVPDQGSAFAGWSGACTSETATCTFSIDDAVVVTAAFEPGCAHENYDLAPLRGSFDSTGGTGSIEITAPEGCPWSAVVEVDTDWIVLDPETSRGIGSGSLGYTVQPHSGTATGRSATITVAGKTHTVSQDPAPCTSTLSAPESTFAGAGGEGDFGVIAPPGCSWTATIGGDATDWIHLDDHQSSISGIGNGTISFSVDPNTSGEARSGSITVADKTHLVIQDPMDCTYALSADQSRFSSAGGEGGFTIMTSAQCPWEATIPGYATDWVYFADQQQSLNGTGTAAISFTVDAHSSDQGRTAGITVAGQTHTVVQDPVLPLIWVTTPDSVATEGQPSNDTAHFILHRGNNLSWGVQVNIRMAGTATNGTDYESIPSLVSFAPGQTSADIYLTPLYDGVYEPDETARLIIDPGTGYSLGANDSAEVTIRDDSDLVLDQSNQLAGAQFGHAMHEDYKLAQTFRPELNNIRRVEIDIMTLNQQGDDTIRLEIYKDGDPDPLGTASEEVAEGFAGLLRFDDFDPPLQVTPGEIYKIAVKGTKSTFAWKYLNTNAYAGGTATFDDGVPYPDWDFLFTTYGFE